MSKGSSDRNVFRVAPFHYLHVLDQNTNVTRVEVGPKTFYRQDNEVVTFGPDKMVTVPPRHYCIVVNPVVRDESGAVVYDAKSLQVKLRHADQEVRLAQDPFPLYPGEVLTTPVTPLTIVEANSALRLKAVLDFADDDGVARTAGDEWLFEGPGTYIPQTTVKVEELIQATIIMPNQALKLRAVKETKDRKGTDRVTGEEWLVKDVGAYLPGVFEEVLDIISAYTLTDKIALHLRATRSHTDEFGKKRRTGEEWLVTQEHTESYIPSVHTDVVSVVDITTLTNRQYAVIVNPVDGDGHAQLGAKKLVKGPATFFLQPGETLEKGVQDVYVLGEDEGIILRAAETFMDTFDGKEVKRVPGNRWMIKGPTEYVPPVEVEVV
jgi:major vault protein